MYNFSGNDVLKVLQRITIFKKRSDDLNKYILLF